MIEQRECASSWEESSSLLSDGDRENEETTATRGSLFAPLNDAEAPPSSAFNRRETMIELGADVAMDIGNKHHDVAFEFNERRCAKKC